ncbi:MAG: hypothetical protein HFJ79_10880 [Clostridiales bacterium]|nr:hypothetical protein [Clostridiales bacterium]
MCGWIMIQSQQDIDYLMSQYGGFHDSCLVGLSYQSGAAVDDNNSMCLGRSEQRRLRVLFHSQWNKKALELCFLGVRKFCVAGWEDNYFCDIFDCHLSFHDDLFAGSKNPIIVWADNADFSPKDMWGRSILAEPSITFIAADNLQWRFTEKGMSSPMDDLMGEE